MSFLDNRSAGPEEQTNHDETSDSYTVPSLSTLEMNRHVTACLQLNAENKINEQNAFELQMIDIFLYLLKKHDTKVTNNLQLASVCLDASGKIYGFRVDKVYSELLKLVGNTRGEKRRLEAANDHNPEQHVRRKRRKNHNIISTVEALKGNLDTRNPLSSINCQIDMLTSDQLLQAKLPQHTSQGIALNLYDDVLLDRVSYSNFEFSKVPVHRFRDFTNCQICPSYATFKFLNSDLHDAIEAREKSIEKDSSEYYFDLNEPLSDYQIFDNNIDCEGGIINKNISEQFQSIQEDENIDIQNIMAKDKNLNTIGEYSHLLHKRNMKKLMDLKLKKNSKVTKTSNKQGSKREYTKFRISFSKTFRKKIEGYFDEGESSSLQSSSVRKKWTENKITYPESNQLDTQKLNMYYNKMAKYEPSVDKDAETNNIRENSDFLNNLNLSQINGDWNVSDDRNNSDDEEQLPMDIGSPIVNDSVMPLEEEGFIGKNLVSVPTITQKIFIPYSQKAKIFDIHKFKQVIWKTLHPEDQNNNMKPKNFTRIYMELKKQNVSEKHTDSLSPALAFVSLLHLANEKQFIIENQSSYSDILIKECNTKS